jgi:hypothetical protein
LEKILYHSEQAPPLLNSVYRRYLPKKFESIHERKEITVEWVSENYQGFFDELKVFEGKGVEMYINGVPANPAQIVSAHMIKENGTYMRDYSQVKGSTALQLSFDSVSIR